MKLKLLINLFIIAQLSLLLPVCAQAAPKSASRAGSASLQNRLIILPLVQEEGVRERAGLWAQFLAGNLAVMHPGLSEFWFGWRVKNIFSTLNGFDSYCDKGEPRPALAEIARKTKVRYWLSGRMRVDSGKMQVKFEFQDFAAKGVRTSPWFDLDLENKLKGFSREFLNWLGRLIPGLPKEGILEAIWPENTSASGIQALEKALRHYYAISAFNTGKLDLKLFETAVLKGPRSYLANDLLGWAFYRQDNFQKAASAFQKAVSLNPRGVGAMSGLFWCGVKTDKVEMTLEWAERKALAREQDPKPAKGSAMYWLGREAEKKKAFEKAAAYYAEAALFNPQKASYATREAKAWLQAQKPEKALFIIRNASARFEGKKEKEKLLKLAEEIKAKCGQQK